MPIILASIVCISDVSVEWNFIFLLCVRQPFIEQDINRFKAVLSHILDIISRREMGL